MLCARWCPTHSLVLEERWEGLFCPSPPDGHDWFTSQKMGTEFWVVDMEFPSDHEQFIVWKIRDGAPILGAYYQRRQELELDVTCGPDYMSKPQHWARRSKMRKKEMSFTERAIRGKP